MVIFAVVIISVLLIISLVEFCMLYDCGEIGKYSINYKIHVSMMIDICKCRERKEITFEEFRKLYFTYDAKYNFSKYIKDSRIVIQDNNKPVVNIAYNMIEINDVGYIFKTIDDYRLYKKFMTEEEERIKN